MLIYKIVTAEQWRAAKVTGVFTGAPIDVTDGYIHFSTRGQVDGTLAKHFAGQTELLLVTVDGDQFGDVLRWELSRGGELFPHLYAPLPVAAAIAVESVHV